MTTTVAERHALRIARDTLRMPDAMAGVMGGPTKAEARAIIERHAKREPQDRREITGPIDGRHFRLIGRETVFEALSTYRNVAGIECVYGRTLDDRFQTVARTCDVTWL